VVRADSIDIAVGSSDGSLIGFGVRQERTSVVSQYMPL
jgi:hypothetical protein